MKEQKIFLKNKTLIYILCFILILSLIPLYYIAKYDHPCVDDYYYGTITSSVYNETGSVIEVIKSSFNNTLDIYETWQGNFTAIFLMGLQPGIFGEDAYIIAPFILLTSFVLCSLAFFYILLTRFLNSDKRIASVVSLVLTLVSMQFTYMPSDSFYWYNGAIYYTFFYSMQLLLFTMIICMFTSSNRYIKGVLEVLSVILAFLIGGSNYTTALLTPLIILFVIALFVLKKDRRCVWFVPIFLASAIALLLSMTAPGNAIRQTTIGEPTNPIVAILLSFVYGGYSIANSLSAPILISFLFLSPFIFVIARNIKFKFKYPIIPIGLFYCFYSAQATPIIYAEGCRIPYRIMNIIYFSFYILMLLSMIVLFKYLSDRFKKQSDMLYNFLINMKSKTLTLASLIFIAVILFVSAGEISIGEGTDGNMSFSNMPMSVSALYSIATGEAATYDSEVNERVALYEDDTLKDVVVEPFTYKPYLLFHTDLTEDASHWKNQHVCMYYEKDSVVLDTSN